MVSLGESQAVCGVSVGPSCTVQPGTGAALSFSQDHVQVPGPLILCPWSYLLPLLRLWDRHLGCTEGDSEMQVGGPGLPKGGEVSRGL